MRYTLDGDIRYKSLGELKVQLSNPEGISREGGRPALWLSISPSV